MSKKNGPEVSRAIFDYYQSIKDPKYKIKLSSSIQLLTESNVVAVSNGGKKTFAQVQAAIRDAYQAVYGTGK